MVSLDPSPFLQGILYFVLIEVQLIYNAVLITAAAAANLLQSCLDFVDPIDGSPPGSPFLGFSRQEYWRGLPFPSPMHESEKWKRSHSVVSDSLRPHGLLLCPWDFPGNSTGVGCHCLFRQLLLYSKVIQFFVHMHSFFIFFLVVTYHRILHIVSCAVQ